MKNCIDCIHCKENKLRAGHGIGYCYRYSCSLSKRNIMFLFSGMYELETPDWCPLKSNQTINMNTQEKIDSILKELSDLSDVKVGDKLYSIRQGEVEIKHISNGGYPICYCIDNRIGGVLDENSCTIAGLHSTNDKYPMVFKKNPYLEIAKLSSDLQEKWMEVSDDNSTWYVRKVITKKDNKYLTWNNATNESDLEGVTKATSWKYAREIQPKPVELTLKDIADKFGINVKQLKIKD